MKRFKNFATIICAAIATLALVAACDVMKGGSGSPAHAKDIAGYIYVAPAPAGNDSTGTGSSAQPYATIAKAISVASSGNTVSLAAGTYTVSAFALPVGINLIGAGAASTTITSTNLTSTGTPEVDSNFLIQLEPGTNSAVQTVSGFTIDGKNKTFDGVVVNSRNNVTLSNVTFNNCSDTGARVFGGSGYITGIQVYSCNFLNCGKDNIAGPNSWSSGNLMIGKLDGADIHDITINDIYGYGIKFTVSGNFKNTKIHDCTIRVSESDPQWGEDISIELWNIDVGNEIYNIDCNTWLSLVDQPGFSTNPAAAGVNLKLHDVKLVDLDGVSSKESVEMATNGVDMYNCYIKDKGFGVAMWINQVKKDTIRDNVFENQFTHTDVGGANGAAVLVATGNDTIKIQNNVIAGFNNAIQLSQISAGANVSNIAIQNNVFLMRSTATAIISKGTGSATNVTVTNNLKEISDYYASTFAACPLSWTTNLSGATVSNNYDGNPGFHDRGDGWAAFYKPDTASSFVVGKGVDVGYGTTLGWHDYDGVFPAPDAVRTSGSTTVVTFQPFTINFNSTTSVDTPTFGSNNGTYGGASISFPAQGPDGSTCMKIIAPNNGGIWAGPLLNQGLGTGVSSAVVSFNVRAASASNVVQFIIKPILGPPATSGGNDAASTSVTYGPGQTAWPTLAVDGNASHFANISIAIPLANNTNLAPGNYGVQLAVLGGSAGGTVWIDDLTVAPPSSGGTTTTIGATTTTTTVSGATTTTTTTVAAATTTTVPATTTTTIATTTTTVPATTTTTTTIASGPTYELLNVGSNLAQQTDSYAGASVYNSNSYTGAANQQWVITAVGSYYKIISASNGYAIQAGGGSINTGAYTGAAGQLWTLTSLGSSQYELINSGNGQAARVQDVYSGNPMQLSAYDGSDNRFKWQLIQVGGTTTTTTVPATTTTTTTTVPTTTTTVPATTTTTTTTTVPTTTTTVPATTTTTTTTVPATTTTTTTTVPATTTSTTTTTVAGSGPVANGTYKIVNKYSGMSQQTDSYAGASIYNAVYTGAANQKWVFTQAGAYYKIVSVATGFNLRDTGYSNVTQQSADNADDQLFTITSAGGGYYYLTLKSMPNRYWKSQDGYGGNPVQDDDFAAGNDRFLFQFLAP